MFCILGLVLPLGIQGQRPNPIVTTSKIIVYPNLGQSISDLKKLGVKQIDDYGSYWIAHATDQQAQQIYRTFGTQAVKADRLNYIELNALRLDTTAGEPAIPDDLRDVDTAGKHLRLIQFKGPVKPQWLEQVKATGDVKILSYVPNNAYVVWLDADAEKKLHGLFDPQGPLQWVGAYHPYYKVSKDLWASERGDQGGRIAVQVAVVDDAEASQTADMIQALGAAHASHGLPGQKVFGLDLPQSEISRIARLPGVLWIQRLQPKRLLDEMQDLILDTQTNQVPGHGPVPVYLGGITYMEFLTNSVGGGLLSLFDPSTYPIVDVADTGLDSVAPDYYTEIGGNATAPVQTPPYPVNPVFYEFGNPAFVNYPYFYPTNPSRVAYEEPPFIAQGDVTGAYDFLGCARVNNNFFGPEDFDGHGTVVASLVTGYDTSTNYTYVCETGLYDTNGNPIVLYYPSYRQDSSGFQYGLGVSPFGRIGASRIFSQNASAGKLNNVCEITITVPTFCNSSLPSLVAYAYGQGARIQNNSWSDVLEVSGTNAGAYTAESQAYDIAVRNAVLTPGTTNTPGPFPLNQEFIAVFAAGDNGAMGSAGGFADIRVTAPATAKNIIAVGTSEGARPDVDASQDSLAIWPQSSVGPTVDGRFKPEIVAPGTILVGAMPLMTPTYNSTNACSQVVATNLAYLVNCNDQGLGFKIIDANGLYAGYYYGSSYAAPSVSGAIQLLWWYFENRLTDELGQSLLQPSPAMAKAYLANSARYLPITNPQTGTNDTLPSIIQGMGEMDLQRMFDGVPRVLRDESTPRAIDVPLVTVGRPQQTYFSQSGQSYELYGQVLSNGLPFRVTVAWTDAAGNPAAFQQLVNNLDLQVTIGGQIYKGNVFSGSESVPGGTFDSVNNMESVFLPAGATTNGEPYAVIVRATTIAGDGVPSVGSALGQDFALVVYNSQKPSDVPDLSTNNSCATAIMITNNPFSFTNSLNQTVYSNVQPSPSAGRGGVDEFFEIALPTPGGVFSLNTIGSSFNTVLSVWRARVIPQAAPFGGCGALVEVTSTNGGSSSAVTFTADGSNNYYVVVEPSNDGPGGTMVLNVSATAPAISVTPNNLVFPNELVGITSAVEVVTYQNNLTNPPVSVAISTISITGSNATDFVIELESCAGNVLGPGQQCAIDIGFAPTTNGLRTAQLVINDAATGSPRIVPLSGNGLPAAPFACVSPSSLIFSNQLVGNSSAQSVTVTNCGSLPLIITNITLTGQGSADFKTISSTCAPFPFALQPGQICTNTISFDPSTNGSRSATLSIFDNALGSPHQVTLLGTGCTPITLTPTTLPDTTTGTAYNQSVTASGGVPLYFFTVTSGTLPPGLVLLGSGVFSGVPSATGTFSFTVAAVDANGCSGSQQYTIHVTCPVLGLTSLTLTTNILIGTPYNQTITTTNGVPQITFANTGGVLPLGLTLTSGGAITGTPTAVGTYPFTVRATDANGCTGSRTYSISITCPLIQLFTTSLPGGILGVPLTLTNGTAGTPYGQTFSLIGTNVVVTTNSIITATGGAPPYGFAVTSGSLPPGLSLFGLATNVATNAISSANSTAVLGIPTQAGTFTFTITATDSNQCTGAAAYSVFIGCPSISLSPSVFPGAEMHVAYIATNSTFGGSPPFTFTITSGSLPPGLVYSSAGVLSGTPTTLGTYNFTVTATDLVGCSVSLAYSIEVGLAVPQVCLSSGNSLAFGDQVAGTTSIVQSVTITNCGTAVLHISTVSLTGANANEFFLTNDTCNGQNLDSGNACTFGVSFAPTNFAAKIASVLVSNNSPVNLQVVSLTGTGGGSQPDLWINKNLNLKTFIGKGVFTPPSPIAAQTLSLNGTRGGKLVFYVAFQNKGDTPDSFLVQGSGGAPGVFTAQYFLGADPNPSESVDITSAVVGGTFATTTLGPDAYTGNDAMMRVVITVERAAPRGEIPVVITGTSSANPAKADSVRCLVKVR
jgi:hypothetical protein